MSQSSRFLFPNRSLRARLRQRTFATRGAKAAIGLALALTGSAALPTAAAADEGGVSVWLPGFFGSLAAAPLQPGWSVQSIDYHTSVSAGADVSRAREITIGQIPLNLNASLSGSVNADADLGLALPAYTFANPVLGGQATVGLLTVYGRTSTSLAATLSGALTTPFGALPFARSDTFSDVTWGFGDLYPLATLRWNSGVNNYMTYVFGDVPVGAYDSARLANIGIGHGAIDAGGGCTYFNPQTGHEISGVLGFTYNFSNPATQYQSGVDMHFDWGASQFLTKQLQIGVVGYFYNEIGCHSGGGDRVGCFQSRVVGIGPQLGYIIPLGTVQAYINIKGYGEFDAQSRPHGWNTWLTVQLAAAPPEPAPSPATARRMYMK